MMLDDTDYKKQRSNLMIISMGIIIFILGDGDIKSASLLGGSVSFGKVNTPYYAVTALYIYMAWRFMIYSKEPLLNFRESYYVNIYTHPVYVKIAKGWLDKNRVDKAELDENARRQIIKRNIFTRPVGGHGTFPPMIANPLYPRKLIYYNIVESSTNNRHTFPFSEGLVLDDDSISLAETFKLLWAELISLLKAVITDRQFSDLILPYLIAYAAAVTLAYTISASYFTPAFFSTL